MDSIIHSYIFSLKHLSAYYVAITMPGPEDTHLNKVVLDAKKLS